ncbi:hypothetical protein JTE90_006919 [Oedothorax gibbosus]|uniref:Dynein intermediate chain 2, ciliary n=1 Tax=Oedothorax gibbosus TaxID=931172 RepID=A0AAV6VNM3_9ARAC|nr:hypothetical protein JTE90_006919 [Oedothorax gibbosus]
MIKKDIIDKFRRKKMHTNLEQIMLTMDELDRDVSTVLTTSNPYFDESAVEYSHKNRAYEPLKNRNSTIMFFCQIGNIKRKDTESDAQGSSQAEESVEELDTKRKNKFNFCDRATQTHNHVHVVKYTQTEPLPQLTFEGSVSPADILQTYIEKESENKLSDEEEAPPKPTRKISRKDTKVDDPIRQRRYFRFCERMIDQNLMSDVNIDFSFYDTPSDEFKEKGFGSLLALWKFSYPAMKGTPVNDLSWNPTYPDMFAVAFGSHDPSKRGSSGGCVCVFSLKCPSHPERVIACHSAVLAVHLRGPDLVALGCSDGEVAVHSLAAEGTGPLARNGSRVEHSDVVYQVKWLPDTIDGRHNFCSISADYRVISWLLAKSELIPTEVINLRQFDLFAKVPERDKFSKMSCGTCISFHPSQRDLFLIGTEGGPIHKWSNLSTAQHLEDYADHQNIVYNVQWNPYHPRVFLSCSADWTIRIWDHAQRTSVCTFDLMQEVRDIAWAPFSSTLFAAVTTDGKVHIFDVHMNRQQSTSSYAVCSSKRSVHLTTVQFNPVKPVLIVGDDRGSVISFKLSPNLRSSLKAFQTTESSKFAAAETEKMEKILKLAGNSENCS